MADKINGNKKQLAKAGGKTIQKIYKSGGAPESYAHKEAMAKSKLRDVIRQIKDKLDFKGMVC